MPQKFDKSQEYNVHSGENGAPRNCQERENLDLDGALLPVKRTPRHSQRIRGARMLFLAAYERYCGNVTKACLYAGISRRTFYRWMNSKTRLNEKFRQKLALIKPRERLLDIAEEVILEAMEERRDLRAAELVTTKLGRHRGYEADHAKLRPEKPPTPAEELLSKVVQAFETFLELKNPPSETIDMWITAFARNGKVDRDVLAKKLAEQGVLDIGRK